MSCSASIRRGSPRSSTLSATDERPHSVPPLWDGQASERIADIVVEWFGVIDLHTHILPGIDDGARTLEDALAMARVFVAEGVTMIAATPHVRDDFPTSANVMLHSVAALRRVLDEEEIPLTLLPGAELAVDWLARLDDDELRRLSLAGSGRYVLVETPYRGWPVELLERLLRLRARGFHTGTRSSRTESQRCRRRRRCSHRSCAAGRSSR